MYVDRSTLWATSRKVADSIPDDVIGIVIILPALYCSDLTHPLTEISTRYVCWALKRPVRRAVNHRVPIVY